MKMTPEKEERIATVLAKAMCRYEHLREKEQTPTASEELLFETAFLLKDIFLDCGEDDH